MSRHRLPDALLSAFGLALGIVAAPMSAFSGVTPYLSAAEEAKTFELRPGYSVQLVLGEPDIQDPTLAVFDGNGRMYVSEMRSFMPNVDGGGQFERTSRVSVHWSSKGDGNFDKHAVFADKLLLPRMVLPLDGGVLINETGTDEIWFYRDSNGDGIADRKDLFLPGGPRGDNLEHQPSGLIWGVDNWLYTAVKASRLRIKGTNIYSEGTPPNYGQWGLSQDDYGKPYFVNAGLEAGPVNYGMPIIYGQSEINGKTTPGFPEVWPLVGMGDYQGGPGRVREPDKTLNHITASCGPDIFRGDRLPAELRGDLFFAEPVGRLIRRAKVNNDQGFTVLSNPYEAEKSEFIRSTDPNFRPVNLVTAPDGTLYIVDMYRGIIQEGAFITPYLRDIILRNGLDKNLGRGRIWRLVHKDFKPGPQPHLLDETPAQLVKHLEHPNGWWRDKAQKLLVLRGDKSVVPAVTRLARSSTNILGRIQALWTLEGLDALEPELVREKLADKHLQVRIAAMRASESLYKAGDQSLMPDILPLARDPDPDIVLQVLMTATYLKWPDSSGLLASVMATNKARGVQLLGPQLATAAAPPSLPQEFSEAEIARLRQGAQVYQQLCFACHGPDGKGAPVQGLAPGSKLAPTQAPTLIGSKIATGYRDGVINVVLKGMTGPLDNQNYLAQMVPMQSNDDVWISAVVSYIRNAFGNAATMVEPFDVARVRATYTNRLEPWTIAELRATLPEPLADRRQWRVSASHNDLNAKNAVDADLKTRYDTRTGQVPGMWFEIRLPSEALIGSVVLDAGTSVRDYPRGYQVEVSSDGREWGQPIATGRGTGALTEIIFPPVKARYIRITTTTPAPGHFWAIHDLQIFKPPPPPINYPPPKKPVTSPYE